MSDEDITHRIDELEPWIRRAGGALLTLHDGAGQFYRDSEAAGRAASSGTLSARQQSDLDRDTKGATSTSRAFLALWEYQRFLDEEFSGRGTPDTKVVGVLKEMRDEYYSRPLRFLRSQSTNDDNMFTNSHILASMSLLSACPGVLPDKSKSLRYSTTKLADEISLSLIKWGGGRISGADGESHDFLTLHGMRALDMHHACVGSSFDKRAKEVENALAPAVRARVVRQLGLRTARAASFDPGDLLFGAVLLARLPGPDSDEILAKSARAMVKIQSRDGSWPTSRVIAPSHRRLLHVASYEMALALVNLFIDQLAKSRHDVCTDLLSALDAHLQLVISSYSSVVPYAGWVNDRARTATLVEAWTTSIVVLFLIRYRESLLALRQQRVLSRYRVQPASGSETTSVRNPAYEQIEWPDLRPTMRPPVSPARNVTARLPDPTADGRVRRGVLEDLIVPVLGSRARRPSTECASFVMYGPPASRKTSLARGIARALDWPLLILSPPDFLGAGGLEGFDRRSREIFDELMNLRRVVVLFDECEDFFRSRPRAQIVENRTVGAFITAGMLPRLQNLRDQRWLIFAIATNVELLELDRAVVRLGRFDRHQRLGYPSLKAQQRYIDEEYTKQRDPSDDLPVHLVKPIKAALAGVRRDLDAASARLDEIREAASGAATDDEANKKLSEASELERRTGWVTFSVIDAVVRDAVELVVDPKDLATALAEVLDRNREVGPKPWARTSS